MRDHQDAALHYEALAKTETQPAPRDVFLATARAFRLLAIADGRRFVRDMPKQPSAQRAAKRKRA
jgi:hypothetical protein